MAKPTRMAGQADDMRAQAASMMQVQANPETGEITMRPANNSAELVATLPEDDEFFYDPRHAMVDPIRQVTIPVFKWQPGQSVYGQITQAIKQGRELRAAASGPKMAPAHVTVIRGVRGQLRTLICGEVLKSELQDAYPEHSYVGRWFALKKIAPDEGRDKRYATYQIIEISDPRPEDQRVALPAPMMQQAAE